jgi:hypothetical protein
MMLSADAKTVSLIIYGVYFALRVPFFLHFCTVVCHYFLIFALLGAVVSRFALWCAIVSYLHCFYMLQARALRDYKWNKSTVRGYVICLIEVTEAVKSGGNIMLKVEC